MPDIVLKNILGQDVTYSGIDTVKLKNTEGNEETFSHGVAVENIEIPVDFSAGDMPISAGDGYLVKNAVVKKPETLLPENIVKDIDVAGVVGTASSETVLNLAETEVIFAEEVFFGGTFMMNTNEVAINYVVEGATYEVVWDGTSYPCTAWKLETVIDEEPVVFIGIGNTAVTGVQSTEPFIIGTVNGEMRVISLDAATSHIVSVTLDLSQDEVLEDVPITLDFSEGNQTINAGDGYVVKTAIIQKPETLIPENIAEGVDIAGVIGTLAAGGGAGGNHSAFEFSHIICLPS